MTLVDGGIIFIIISLAIVGIFRGLFKEIISTISLLAALILPFYLAELPLLLFPDEQWQVFGFNFSLHHIAFFISFAIICLFILLIGNILGHLINMLVHGGIDIFDRILGFIFGVVRGSAIVLIVITAVNLTTIPLHQSWMESALVPTFEQGGNFMVKMLPVKYRDYFPFPTIPNI